MPAISFSTLKDKILSGEKKQTIRPFGTGYWLRFRKGDRLVGYWKMRTKQCEKLFESKLIEDPFTCKMMNFNGVLMRLDGFKDLEDGMNNWFIPHYGNNPHMKFIIIRWE